MKFYNVASNNLSGSFKDCFVKSSGDTQLNLLYSYVYLKNLSDEKLKEAFEIARGSIMIDSGAFTAWRKHIEFNEDEYIEFINKWDEYVTLFGQIDVIPPKGKLSYEELCNCCDRTWDNYLYMQERIKSPKKLLYTFHFGEPRKYLEQALEWRDKEGNSMEYMALGGLVGRSTNDRIAFLDKCFEIIYNSSNPHIKVHGFGVSSEKLWIRYPFESCDSSTAMQEAIRLCKIDETGSYRIKEAEQIKSQKAKNDKINELKLFNMEYFNNLAESIEIK